MIRCTDSTVISINTLIRLLRKLSLKSENEDVEQKSSSSESEEETMESPKRVRKICFISNKVKNPNNYLNESKSIEIVKNDLAHDWNIRFENAATMDPYLFIDIVTEKKKSVHITDDEILNIVPELLTGHALQWYNRYKNKLHTWQDFVVNLTQSYNNENQLPSLNNEKKKKKNKKKKKKKKKKAVSCENEKSI